MLNLNDLSISELNAYCDGLKEAVEILQESTHITDFTALNDQYSEVQRIIEIRFAEDLKNRAFEDDPYRRVTV